MPARRARTRTKTMAMVNTTWAPMIVCRPDWMIGGAPSPKLFQTYPSHGLSQPKKFT